MIKAFLDGSRNQRGICVRPSPSIRVTPHRMLHGATLSTHARTNQNKSLERRVPMEFRVSFIDGYFDVKLTGKANVHDWIAYLDHLLTHEQWKPGSLVLSDETDLRARHLTAEEIRAMAGVCGERRHAIGEARLAVFVESDLVYGLNRMLEGYVEPYWDATFDVFRSRAEAMKWLNAHKAFPAEPKNRSR